jgi:hypothetical protein
MPTRVLQLRTRDERFAAGLIGKQALPEHAPILVRGDADIFKSNGDPLLFLRRAHVSPEAKESGLPFLRMLRNRVSWNRGAYAGEKRVRVKRDGTVTNTSESAPVRSMVVGYFDRYPRTPYCRESAFTSKHPEAWAGTMPLIREVSGLMSRCVPHRYAAQAEAAAKAHPAYVIAGTPFTTLTVNNTVAGCYHRDAGDFSGGFGCMAVFRSGEYDGCHLVFPAYGIAVDLLDRDVVLFDPHEVHGNTAFSSSIPDAKPMYDFERISVVFYLREKILACESPEKELARAKAARGGFDIDPADPSDDPAELEAEVE